MCFTNYLNNRTKYVEIVNFKSYHRHIKLGVPQGSTLGPLLFFLYIDDCLNLSTKLNFRLFADETNIFFFS